MKNKIITFLIILVLCIMVTFVIVIEINRVKIEKVKQVTSDIVKENYDFEVTLQKYSKNVDKTGHAIYTLYFAKVEGMEIYGKLNIDDIHQITTDDSISLNIEDIKLAKKVQEKYGENYEVIQLKLCIANEWYPLPYYQFLLKNKAEGYPYFEGKVPVNRNVDEIFEENENSKRYN
ncbi:MAG: hypothetical protein PHP54_01795 [Clostridia bacterium]|nr:hypothetical protein [Clostridia bacterium]